MGHLLYQILKDIDDYYSILDWVLSLDLATIFLIIVLVNLAGALFYVGRTIHKEFL
jgi:hypothetical protein